MVQLEIFFLPFHHHSESLCFILVEERKNGGRKSLHRKLGGTSESTLNEMPVYVGCVTLDTRDGEGVPLLPKEERRWARLC